MTTVTSKTMAGEQGGVHSVGNSTTDPVHLRREGRTDETYEQRREVESPPDGVATVLGSPRVG